MKNPIEVSVVAPCYNEEKVLPEFIRRIQKVLLDSELSYEIIIINDGSRDRTMEVLMTISQKISEIKIIDFSRNFGHQAAITAGMDIARGRAVIIIDADLQDPPEVITMMIEKWRQGYEVVYGQRDKRKGETFLKLLTAKLFYRMLHIMTNTQIPIDTGDFRLMDRKVVDAVNAMRERHRFIRGMVSWAGFRQISINYTRNARFTGKTNFSYPKMFMFAFDAITSFSAVPLRIITAVGLIILTATFILSTVIVITRLANPGYFIPGFSAVFFLILFFGGMTLFAIGILGEYIGRIFEEVKQRPLYMVRQIHETKNTKQD